MLEVAYLALANIDGCGVEEDDLVYDFSVYQNYSLFFSLSELRDNDDLFYDEDLSDNDAAL